MSTKRVIPRTRSWAAITSRYVRGPLHRGPGTLLAVGVTVVLWASAFAGIRAGLDGYDPEQLALLRFLVASSLLGVYAIATRMRVPARRDVPAFLLAGLLGITLYNLLLNAGQRSVGAGVASVIVNIGPIFTTLLAIAFLRERLRVWGWIGMGISFTGATIIALGRGGDLTFDPRLILVLLAALAQSMYFVRQKPLLTTYTPLECSTYVIWSGTLWLLFFLPGLPTAMGDATLEATLAVIYLGLFPAALAYFTWAYVLANMPASRAASFLYLVPPVAFLIGWLWLGEIPTLMSVLGGAIALSGVVVVQTFGRAAAEAAEPVAERASTSRDAVVQPCELSDIATIDD